MKPVRNSTKRNTDVNSIKDRFLKGDDLAYAELYRIYAKDIYAFGLSLRAKPQLIEDAIHDIFVEIYARREKLSAVNNLKLYLMIAFKNRLFYLMKKEEISTEISDRYTQFYTDADFVDTWTEIESDGERNSLIHKLLSELNIHQREVIYHRFVEGMSIHDIAMLMNINHQSVKNLLNRTIKKMRSSSAGHIINILIIGLLLIASY